MSRKVVTPIILVVIVLSVLLHAYWRGKREVKELRRQFPSIPYDRKLNHTIREIFNPELLRDPPNHAFVIFSNFEKATIETTYEINTDTLSLDDVLTVGDSVVKDADSNLILVYKPVDNDSSVRQVFRFLLWDFKDI